MSRAEKWDNAELSDYIGSAEDADEEPTDTVERPDWEPQQTDRPDTGSTVQCPCGNRPTKQFARVFGDNSNEIVRCPDCSTYRELKKRGAVGGESE